MDLSAGPRTSPISPLCSPPPHHQHPALSQSAWHKLGRKSKAAETPLSGGASTPVTNLTSSPTVHKVAPSRVSLRPHPSGNWLQQPHLFPRRFHGCPQEGAVADLPLFFVSLSTVLRRVGAGAAESCP